MKKMAGFIDPYTLGFLISFIGTGLAVMADSREQQAATANTEMVQPAGKVAIEADDSEWIN